MILALLCGVLSVIKTKTHKPKKHLKNRVLDITMRITQKFSHVNYFAKANLHLLYYRAIQF